jgi:chromate reductase
MEKVVKILGIVGSLRKKSYNNALMQVAFEVLPKGATLQVFDIKDIPQFNQDDEQKPPDVVKDLKSMIRKSDAVLIACPEYNYSVPGVLKNAIDWASRPYGDNAWEGKPVAVMSASIGMIGGARAQYHLRQIFVFLNMYPINQPEVMMPFAEEKVDNEGKIADKVTRELVKQLLTSLIDWTRKILKE